jgi:ribose transport system permease protein
MTSATEPTRLQRGSRWRPSKGFLTIAISTIILFVVCAVLAPSSVSGGAIQGMLPFAAVLAIVGLGQMLVVQQGGIDLSVPGAVSLTVVIVSHYPNGDSSKLGVGILIALAWCLGAGLLNGFLVGRLGLNSIIATLGTNALLYGAVLGISNGIPRSTTRLLNQIATGRTLGIPHSVIIAVVCLVVVVLVLKKTAFGRRFEAVGANRAAARATGLRVRTHNFSAFVWAQVLYCIAGVVLGGIILQPTAFQGDAYLLPSVAVVVLGGTSLLGGRGFPVSTVIAALFLSQLDAFVLALGVPFAIQTLVQAAALAVGVATYTVDWRALREKLTRTPREPAATAT